MFTGLIETTAKLAERNVAEGAGKLVLIPHKELAELKHGESIAVNGACLTLEEVGSSGQLTFHVLEETLKRTNLGKVPIGATVNLERSMALGDRMGGHLVTGHIDITAEIREIRQVTGGDWEFRITLPKELAPFVVEKGCIAVDGISLTVVEVKSDSFTVHIIPVTIEETGLKDRKVGFPVNLEGDLIGKYVQKQLAVMNNGKSPVNMDSLTKSGW